MRIRASAAVLVLTLGVGWVGAEKRAYGQEKPRDAPAQEPRRAEVVGSVDVNDYIATKARLLSAEAQLKECQERLKQRSILRRILKAIFDH